nr:hypothetical protein [Tanacetum cinerariifolium]
MSTRSSARNLFPPLDNPELTIRRRPHVDPTLLNDFEIATDENDDPPVLDLRTMEELCQPTLNGRVNGVTVDALRLYLFPHALTHHATAWFDRFPRNSITTFEQMAKMFLEKYFPPSMVTKLRNEITNFRQRPDESLFEAWERYKLSIDRCPNHNMLPVTQIDTFYNGLTLRHHDTIITTAGGTFMKRRPEECYDLIENMTAHHNDWDTSVQWSESSSSITSFSDPEIIALKAEMTKINKNLIKVLQINQQVKAVAHNCETCGGPHSYNDFPVTIGQTQNVYAEGAYNQSGNSYQPQGNRNLLSYHLENYLGPPGFNQNQNRNNPNQNYQNQNRNQGNNHGIPQGNNQGRNQFFQGASHGQNPSPTYQAPGYQASVHQAPIPQPQVVTTTEFTNYMKANDAILKNMRTNMTSLTNSNIELKNMFGQFMKMNTALSSGSGTLLSNTITNPKEDLKGITTRSGNAYKGPTIPTTSPRKVMESETEVTKDMVPPTNNGSTKDVQPLVIQIETPIPNFEPVVSPVSAPKPNQKPSIPYPSRLHDQKLRDKANDQKEKFFQIFKDLDFNITRTPLNEHCSAILLKKLPKKLGDPDKFLIPCDFPGMDECLALADLDASINLMPLSMRNKLSLPELSPTCMSLELADHLISRPVGVAEDVFVKVGTFYFPTDFVVVDFDADPRDPLILGRSFLKTGLNRIDLIDVACEDHSQEVLGFFMSGNPTPSTEPIVSNSSPTLTSFGDSDFLLKETDAFLAIDDEPISPEIDDRYYDSEGDILLFEEFLNDDPSSPHLPPQELKVVEPTNEKSFIDEPPVVELKDLPLHLEYAFLEGDNKLPVIIAKDLKYEEKTALIKVLKSHKQALAWKLSDIKENELIPTRLVTGWRVCIDYRKLNDATRKDHFPLPFMDQMLERLAGNEYYCFLDGFSGYFQIPIDPQDQEKTTFTYPYGTFANQGIVLGHKISKNEIEVDKAKVDVIAKPRHPTTVKGIRSFLGHAGFYRRFIQDFLKIARLMTRLLEKDTPFFFFFKECIEAFQTLKKKLTEAPILVPPD